MPEPHPHPEPWRTEPQWLPLPDVAGRLGVALRDVRGMLTERRLLAVRRLAGAVPTVPSTFLTEPDETGRAQVLPGLQGTLVHLSDAGLDEEQILSWLHQDNDIVGEAPIALLRRGSVRAARRAAQIQVW